MIFWEKVVGYCLKVCIGFDFQVWGMYIEFVSVIVFLCEKKGGFMFIYNMWEWAGMGLCECMIIEVVKLVEVAYSFCDLLDKYNVELEVYVDINIDLEFQFNVVFKEVMGYILSMGFVFKVKFNVFVSFFCVDKVV